MSHDNKAIQKVIEIIDDIKPLMDYFAYADIHKVFIVCGKSFENIPARKLFDDSQFTNVTKFSDFSSNPVYESVLMAIRKFNESQYDAIIAVGGGSAIDVAKCVKLSANALLIAIPTTAGSGAEATHFSVIYKNGIKTSVADEQSRPDVVVMWPRLLMTLPEYQRKSTMLDALCHAIESAWSINSTSKSMEYSLNAIEIIRKYECAYLENTNEGNGEMLIAANKAGKAIDIARTTAAHAMSYGLTTMTGITHGHAAAICLKVLLPFVVNNTCKCIDTRGRDFLEHTLKLIAKSFGSENMFCLCHEYTIFLDNLHLQYPMIDDETIKNLVESVNAERLSNLPVYISKRDLEKLYRQIAEER